MRRFKQFEKVGIRGTFLTGNIACISKEDARLDFGDDIDHWYKTSDLRRLNSQMIRLVIRRLKIAEISLKNEIVAFVSKYIHVVFKMIHVIVKICFYYLLFKLLP